MVCASAFLDAQRVQRAAKPSAPVREPEKTTRGNDEAGGRCRSRGSASTTSPRSSSPRQTGVQHLIVLHRLSDLGAAGDDGSRQQRSPRACSPRPGPSSSTASTPEEVADAADALGLSSTEAQRIGHYPQGVALWRSAAAASRSATSAQPREWRSPRPTPRWRRASPRRRAAHERARSARMRGSAVAALWHARADRGWAWSLAAPVCVVWLASAIAGLLASGRPLADRTGRCARGCSPASRAPRPTRARVARDARAASCRVALALQVELVVSTLLVLALLGAALIAAGVAEPPRRAPARGALRLPRRARRAARPPPAVRADHPRCASPQADRRRAARVGARRRPVAVGQDHRPDRARDPRMGRTGALDVDQERRRPRHPRRARQARRGVHLRPDRLIRPAEHAVVADRRRAILGGRAADRRTCSASASTAWRAQPTRPSGARPARGSSRRCCSPPRTAI